MKKIKDAFKMFIRKVDYKDIIIFLIPFIFFGIYLIIFYPGVLSYDSYNQLHQIKEMTFNSSHPFFHTFIEMVLMKIINTPAMIGIFQISFFSILWSRICKYNRNKYNKLSLGYQILLTVIICFNPLNKVLSITLWKDVLYSYMLLWFCFEMEKAIDKKFKLELKDVIKISLMLAIIPNLRHNGYLITLLMSIILFIIFIVKDKKRYNYLKLAGFVVVFLLGFKGLNKLYNVDKGLSVTGIGSIIDYKMIAVTGEIGRYGNYTKEEATEIDKYINFECMKRVSKYNLLDPLWLDCKGKPEIMEANKVNMYKTIFKMMSKNVWVSIRYFLKEWGYVWRIVRYKDSFGNINYLGIYSYNANEMLYRRPFERTFAYDLIYKYVIFSRENVIFQTVFYSGSLCLYLSILILIYLKKKKKVSMFLVFLPTLINTIGIALTASVNDVRYYYSNFLVLYLMGAILIKYWLNNEK